MLRLCTALALILVVCACDAAASTPEGVPLPVASTAPHLLINATPATLDTASALSAPGGTIVASVYRNSDWDIYALSPSGVLLRRLTFGEGDNRAPAWSPDGQRIAFESNRGQNWDIYSMRADGSDLRRLTTDPHFDGSPRWSPDGQHIAFTSDRDGRLDIWVMRADGSQPVNLSSSAASIDYDPAWAPDGNQIAFTSLRDGAKAVFLMNADGSNVRRLTAVGVGEADQPAWSPDGAHIAFIAEHEGAREVYQLDVADPQNLMRLTALEYHQWPAWAPDGSGLIFVAQSEDGQGLESVQPGKSAVRLTFDNLSYRQPDWSATARVESDPASLQQTDEPLYVERTTPNPPERPDRYNLVRLNGVNVIVRLLSDTVDDSFVAARQRVGLETGWDFMAQLSEAARPLNFNT